MRYGISIPNLGTWADPRTMVGLARDAEAAGWDGFFLWDHIRFSATPVAVQDGMPFEIFDEGVTPGPHDPAVAEQNGATWWIEDFTPWRYGWDKSERWPEIGPVRYRIRSGPPRSTP